MVDLRKTGSSARFFNKLQKQKKKREKSSSGEGDKGAKREQKGAKREPHVSVAGFSNMSSEEDVPAPSPSAAVKHAEFTDYIQDIFMPEFSS